MNTTKPTTLGELQLFKVLQRANLLSYYENFISQGGDDVQQLCEAGEEEFLEIMALVGMACKPLHVRRLQKALQEWVTRPAIFRGTNIHYLPAQSVSLTSLGIDTRDLPVTNSNQTLLTSPGTPKSGVMLSQDDDLLNRPLSIGGSAMTTPVKSLNGIESVFRMDSSSRRVNGTTNKAESVTDSETANDNLTSSTLDQQIQKFVENQPTAYEKTEVVKQLKVDRGLRELAIAIEDCNRVLMENLIREHVNHIRSSDNVTRSRHETLVVDAAVKLCLADERYLLKKSELFSAAEKIAIEVKSKLPSRRRSSTHLHGSCSQSRMQEVVNRLQNMKTQRADLHQSLAEAQNHKNVIKENECQNILTRISREESVLLQEKNDLEEKLKYENKEVEGAATHREQSSGFSTDLADLAKAHNLSFGNIPSMPSSSQWSLRDNNAGSSIYGLNGSTNAERSNSNLTPHQTSCLSPPRVVSIDFNKGIDSHRERSPQEINRIKVEDTLNEAPGFPPNNSSIFRSNKRKLSTGSSNGADTITHKRILGSGTNSE